MRTSKALKRVCMTPQVSGVGGMVSFQAKLMAGFLSRGIEVTFNLVDEQFDAALVVGGTRQIVALRRLARRGIPIVQRLDGMNWLHRRLPTGARHWLRAEIGNWILAYIRDRVTSRIVYQSEFVKEWWQRVHGQVSKNYRVIYNGIDLDIFQPNGTPDLPADRLRILMVEGNLQGGYELGIESAVALAEGLETGNGKVELIVAGQVSEKLRSRWDQKSKIEIQWVGVIPNEQLPALYKNAHFLFSGDLNAACPNSVIEAMACGLPVLAFDTGALKELVSPQAGRIVPYSGDPWMLELPNIPALAAGAKEIVGEQTKLRAGARARAEESFGLDRMVDAYVEVLSG